MNNQLKQNFIPLKQYRILTHLLNQGEEKYKGLATCYPKNLINYKDLVYTLRICPDQYLRPIVELEDYGFIVRGNNIFFKAGLEAGMKSFICDVNINTLRDRHMSQFQLLDVLPEKKEYLAHSVFFIQHYYQSYPSQEKLMNHWHQALRNFKINPKCAELNLLALDIIEIKIYPLEGENIDLTLVHKSALMTIHEYAEIRSICGLKDR